MTLQITLEENVLFNLIINKLVNHTKFAGKNGKLNLVEYSTRIDTYSHHVVFTYGKYTIFAREYDIDESVDFSIVMLEPKYNEVINTKDVDEIIEWINIHDEN